MFKYKKRQIVICFKSEDRCGKDTMSEIALDYILKNTSFTCDVISNARDVKKIVASLLNIKVEELDHYKNNDTCVKIELDGKIEEKPIRDFMISLSQNLVKNLGRAIFIDKIVSSIFKSELDIVIVSDLRFEIEYKKLTSKFLTYVIEIESDLETCGKNGKRYELDKIPSDFVVENIEGKKDFAKKELEKILFSIVDEN